MKTFVKQDGFHHIDDHAKVNVYVESLALMKDLDVTYTFHNSFHPFVGEMVKRLNERSLRDLMDPVWQGELERPFFSSPQYQAMTNNLVHVESFPKKIDVSDEGAYAGYNWELFFHIPLTIAVHLSKNQKFAEAQRWFHTIFDPTSTDTSVPAPARYWKFLRFREATDVQQIDELLTLLSKPDADCTPAEKHLKAKVMQGYEDIRRYPFKPHIVARTRTTAYQYNVVMKYLDNLIAWGDSLFMQDTVESINEATQRYVLAATLLGPRPQRIPPTGTVKPKTFAQLQAEGLDEMGNTLVELESAFPFSTVLPAAKKGSQPDHARALFGLGQTLYFCVPRNDKLLAYWDTVADRLFKVRNCMNIQGVVRQLALFDPPIDPGMLVKAAAAGIDIGSIVAGLNQPPAPVRSRVLLGKAVELAAEVRDLGRSLLEAIEKRDGERLALLKQSHEMRLARMSREVQFLQLQQAKESTETLVRARKVVHSRYRRALAVMGRSPDDRAPETLQIERVELNEENFDEMFARLVEEYDKQIPEEAETILRLAGSVGAAAQSGHVDAGALMVSVAEALELDSLIAAKDAQLAASVSETIAQVLTLIPEMDIDLHFWGLGASSTVFGGSKLSDAAKTAGQFFRTIGGTQADSGNLAGRTGQYERRSGDVVTQANTAGQELQQLGRQIISSLIAEQIAEAELRRLDQQIEQAEQTDEFLRSKFTNQELYAWLQGEISRIYYDSYRFAVDVARKAERTMKVELMRPEVDATDFVKFNYWDGGRKGLLAGESLLLDLRRMEMAHLENNKREFELTRAISLRQLNPLALLSLKVTGSCEIALPEWLYDLDCPGHYMRRLKSVSLTLSGAPAPVHCTLTLLRSRVRRSPVLGDGDYKWQGPEDARFVEYVGQPQQIVTSGEPDDAGMFELNLAEERFLPFEGAGAIGTWRLELPKKLRPFDYAAISDVVMHVRYTARQGGEVLARPAVELIEDMLSDSAENPSEMALLFSMRNDFSAEWAAFTGGPGSLTITVRRNRFPYAMQSKEIVIKGIDLFTGNGDKLAHRAGPSASLGMADSFDLSIAPDATVVKKTRPDVFMIVRYSIE